MTEDIHKEAMKRLAYIDGHLQGIKKMVDEERYCVDILKQTHAIRKAIEKLDAILLDGHLETCVVQGIQQGHGKRVVAELRALYAVGR